VGKKKKKLKKRCCGKFLKEGKHCKNCPILLKESNPAATTDPGQKKGDRKKKKKEKKEKKIEKGKKK
jgi:hypothetical protein